MHPLIWKLNRLRAMSPAELMYRVKNAVQARVEQSGFGLAQDADAMAHRASEAVPWSSSLSTQFDRAVYLEAADRILQGRFDVFAVEGAELGFPPNWQRDPKTGTVAPQVFGKTLNYRDERLVGDIKYLWEPSRHIQLVTLAQAWHLSGERRYLDGCGTLVDSWLEQCHYPLGVHWTSSLELGVRLLNWSIAWHLIGGERSPLFVGEPGRRFRERWLASVYQHCHFIAGHLSLYSSANNHLLGEYMGLLVGAVTWPLWPQSVAWRETARCGFESEVLAQNGEDGVNREQAVYYQHEVVDMMLLCGLIGRANGLEFGPAYWQRIEKLLEFLEAVMDTQGRVPMIGDADDAVMVRFDPRRGADVYRPLLAIGAVLFDRPRFAAKAGRFDDKSRWLLGDAASERFEALRRQGEAGHGEKSPPPRAFPGGGYYLLGDRLGMPDEVRLLADAGPLGYLSIAAHGHADALSFTLGSAGREWLIDPGTFSYHTQRKWREYFRGTSAHNTLRVDGQSQSTGGGNFIWVRHANARCLGFESTLQRDRFEGMHDGYASLPDPVLHRREILFDKSLGRIDVRDALECRTVHGVELHWHFAEDCEVRIEGHLIQVRCGADELEMSIPAGLQAECVAGQEDPPLGWVSRRFDDKRPSPTVRCHGRIDGSTVLATRITLRMGGRA